MLTFVFDKFHCCNYVCKGLFVTMAVLCILLCKFLFLDCIHYHLCMTLRISLTPKTNVFYVSYVYSGHVPYPKLCICFVDLWNVK